MSRVDTNIKIIKFIQSNVNLKEYSGFGGLHKIMTKDQHQELKNILGPDVYKNVMASCKTAYYTHKDIISFIYQSLVKMGFTGGKLLEPACGHGAFIFNMPSNLIENCIIHAVELDRLSARITKAICPYAKILNHGFEATKFKANTFDAIVGNPPYGSQTLIDSQFSDINGMALHHFFTAKSVHLLKDKGVMAFVLPQYCFDNLHDHPRHIMAQHGSLIAAFRLPDNMFDNAKVTVDIVFYTKQKLNNIAFTEVKNIQVKGHKLRMNEYYVNHPENILGELDTCNMYGQRIGLTVKSSDDKETIFKQLSQKIDGLPVCIDNKKNTTDFDMFASIDQALEKLKQKQATQNELQAKLTDFEIEKIIFLKQALLEQEKSFRELQNQIKTTVNQI
jgi:type I restriction-modification system DNA methylase subunit